MSEQNVQSEAAAWLEIFKGWQYKRALKDAKLVKSILSAWGIS